MKISSVICLIILTILSFNSESSNVKKAPEKEGPLVKEKTQVERKLIVRMDLPSFDKKSLNPYFALWLSKENSEHKALKVTREKIKWLRDLKRFWRNIARENRKESDAVTGATSKAKHFDFEFIIKQDWDYISLEVVREHGKKELITVPLSSKNTCINGQFEIKKFCIELQNK